MPKDEDGRVARECPNSLCSPGYFKVTPGTGITGEQAVVYCPYCKAEPSEFTTQEQIRYVKDVALREAQGGIDDMIKDAFGLGSYGKKKIGGGFISIEMAYKPSTSLHVRRPYEDEVRRDVVCSHYICSQKAPRSAMAYTTSFFTEKGSRHMPSFYNSRGGAKRAPLSETELPRTRIASCNTNADRYS